MAREEAYALLTRAATLEAQRQSAVRDGDERKRDAIMDELRALWRRYSELTNARAEDR